MITKLLSAVLVALFLFPYNILACACCAEPGDHFEYETKIGEFESNNLSRIALGSSVLFTDGGLS